MYILAN